MNAFSRGFWSGMIATGPMTLGFFRFFKKLPPGQKSPLPPATLSYQSSEAVNLGKHLDSDDEVTLAMSSHFAYGAGCGVVYAETFSRLPGPPVVKGSIFGLGVWAASYLGWTPLLGFRASAPNMTKERNWMMIASHIVWGASLGYAEDALRERGHQMLSGHKKAALAE